MVKPLPHHSPGSFVRYSFTITGVKLPKNTLFKTGLYPVGEWYSKVLNFFQGQPQGGRGGLQ